MSATIGASFLQTLDRINAKLPATPVVSIPDDDPSAATLFKATRHVSTWKQPKSAKVGKAAKKTSSKNDNPRDSFLCALADSILQEHKNGTLSLVVCNNVATAQTLSRLVKAAAGPHITDRVTLLTSRFRPKDRADHLGKLLAFEHLRKHARNTKANIPHQGLICISTQVVEAGVDVSSRRLWSELAPWASILQRLGRLNRDGHLNQEAHAFIFEVPSDAQSRSTKSKSGPYDPVEIKVAQKIVAAVESACETADPSTPIRQILKEFESDKAIAALLKQSLEPRPEPFPRAMDVHGLFSTEPDAFGGFTDVSSWVRGSDPNADVTVFWRAWPDAKTSPNDYDGPGFQRDEGCPVAVHRIRPFIEAHRQAWTWNPTSDQWVRISPYELCPGMTILLPASSGGYSTELGWTADKKHSVEDLSPPGPFEKRNNGDAPTQAGGHWVPLNDHLKGVADSMGEITAKLGLPKSLDEALHHAAALHDIGKSIELWQDALPHPLPSKPANTFWAKAPFLLKIEIDPSEKSGSSNLLSLITKESPSAILVQIKTENADSKHLLIQIDRHLKSETLDTLANMQGVMSRPRIAAFRPGLRHEAASALAAWHRYYHTESADFPALTIYLIAAHHGLVRTTLSSREKTGKPNICGIPINRDFPLPWQANWKLDFECARDGTSGGFSEDGHSFVCNAPGWSGLVADLLGGWESDAPKGASGAVPFDEPHSLNAFNLSYLEVLLRAADARTSATEQGLLPSQANFEPLPLQS